MRLHIHTCTHTYAHAHARAPPDEHAVLALTAGEHDHQHGNKDKGKHKFQKILLKFLTPKNGFVMRFFSILQKENRQNLGIKLKKVLTYRHDAVIVKASKDIPA